ncbi:hypothetical protein D3C78_1469760 [compost metagenome]
MRPGGVGTGQYHQIRLFDIFITTRHHIPAECPLVADYRRRHAQPGVGVDIGRTNKSLHQFVCHVIIFGQQLTGSIKRHRLRAILLNNLAKTLCHLLKRLIPANRQAIDLRL